jgi:hypothetical protein
MRTIQDYHTPMIGRGHDLSKQRMDARNGRADAKPRDGTSCTWETVASSPLDAA